MKDIEIPDWVADTINKAAEQIYKDQGFKKYILQHGYKKEDKEEVQNLAIRCAIAALCGVK